MRLDRHADLSRVDRVAFPIARRRPVAVGPVGQGTVDGVNVGDRVGPDQRPVAAGRLAVEIEALAGGVAIDGDRDLVGRDGQALRDLVQGPEVAPHLLAFADVDPAIVSRSVEMAVDEHVDGDPLGHVDAAQSVLGDAEADRQESVGQAQGSRLDHGRAGNQDHGLDAADGCRLHYGRAACLPDGRGLTHCRRSDNGRAARVGGGCALADGRRLHNGRAACLVCDVGLAQRSRFDHGRAAGALDPHSLPNGRAADQGGAAGARANVALADGRRFHYGCAGGSPDERREGDGGRLDDGRAGDVVGYARAVGDGDRRVVDFQRVARRARVADQDGDDVAAVDVVAEVRRDGPREVVAARGTAAVGAQQLEGRRAAVVRDVDGRRHAAQVVHVEVDVDAACRPGRELVLEQHPGVVRTAAATVRHRQVGAIIGRGVRRVRAAQWGLAFPRGPTARDRGARSLVAVTA